MSDFSPRPAIKVPVWNKRIHLNFQIRGRGPALIYFHPAAGLAWDPFLEKLSESYTYTHRNFRERQWAIRMPFNSWTICRMRCSL